MMRRPVVAGHFYPQTEEALRKMLAGLVKTGPDKQKVMGVILPHAGYVYSGPVAGATVSKIEIKKTAVILGTDHTGSGSPFSIVTKGRWLTPLGEVKIDAEIAGSILKSSRLLKDDDRGHVNEHSIEVQLPFLQYLKADIKIVPIIISGGGIEEYRELGGDIAEGFKKAGRPAVF
ncbi:MAG TPA: AmmeMemoRadiSam system protein B, partial [Candidatus Omnitrophica bacterium]|nr:AmmeMemoRadiSam system protein B [Candidatus Omnitrophota bacterium]